jgi:Cu(I)/Ag(I) efflux system protein CusF
MDHQKFLTLTHEENMKNIQTKIAIALLTIGAALPLSSFSQAVMDHSKMNMSQMTPSLTDGEVKKIDLETGKVTIKHGEIKHMDMPGMTMVFTAKDKSLLTSIKPGEKIKFMVINEGGKMIVTDIQLVQ